MRAIGYRKASPALDHLEAFDIPRPQPESRDLLVEVRAVSVNPVDYKVASGGGLGAPRETDEIKVVGYDAAGVVADVGWTYGLLACAIVSDRGWTILRRAPILA